MMRQFLSLFFSGRLEEQMRQFRQGSFVWEVRVAQLIASLARSAIQVEDRQNIILTIASILSHLVESKLNLVLGTTHPPPHLEQTNQISALIINAI